jgi:hypothetical protein
MSSQYNRIHHGGKEGQNMKIDFDQYQKAAGKTAVYGDGSDRIVRNAGACGIIDVLNMNYAIVGLGGEAGELLNTWQKYLRGDDSKGRGSGHGIYAKGDVMPSESRRQKLMVELGGVLWFAAAVANEFGITLNDVAVQNLHKLFLRMQEGVIQGDGDDR